jgi:hypothetical protein
MAEPASALPFLRAGGLLMFAALSAILIGVVGILFVRRRGARKRADAPAR